jgi:phosphoribosylformylglycinamidine synthase subunit PurSL
LKKSPSKSGYILLSSYDETLIIQVNMSRHIASTSIKNAYRITVASTLPTRTNALLSQLPTIGITSSISIKIQDIYFLEGNLTRQDLERLTALICDPVTDSFQWQKIDDRVADLSEVNCIEVALRPGVTDNVASQLLRAAHQIEVNALEAVATGQSYQFDGNLSQEQLHHIASSFLVNNTVQRYTLGEIRPEFVKQAQTSAKSEQVSKPELIPIAQLDESELLDLSKRRRLALDLNEMKAIQEYFSQNERYPTDGELETLAQTWSEHCVHKTFKARILLPDGSEVDGLLKTTIQAASAAIAAEWVRSAFVDNAGIIAFDDQYDLSFKVETHNHPSAIEPFGGANTGVGGVVRDNLGVSHRPIAVTDVLCFGPSNQPYESLPKGVLHPRRIRSGVVAGVGDYGNKLGLATVNGAVLYHNGYTANPLVYCGCVGIGPCNTYPREPQPADRIVVVGGRTGRDGLRGATFSSLTMDAQTGQVAGAAVQIGDPITEKGVIEVITRARDQGLYHAVTDCGAGGLSSAVGEMSANLGASVDLQQVPLKYTGLEPWEIWLSEAQERMVLAVPPAALPALLDLCKIYEVEMSDIGEFIPSGRLEVFFGDIPVVSLDEDFLHNGIPRQVLWAAWPPPKESYSPDTQQSNSTMLRPGSLLLSLLSHPNISSKEGIIRQYDHEVRGATIVRPLTGVAHDGPADAAVMKPLETDGFRGFVLANGINPFIGEVDPYAMAFSCVDEAIRNAVAVGGDPQRLALLDNFCWGNPRRPETLGSLVRAAQGCRDASLYYKTPFISGKDSLNNEYIGSDGQRHAIPGTLLISSIAIHPDIRFSITLDIKAPENVIYLVGDFQPALDGSHALLLVGAESFADISALNKVPQRPVHARQIYQALHTAMMKGLVCSAHDLSEGGLAVAAAEMAIAGRLGINLELSAIQFDPMTTLFGETNGCLLVEIESENATAFEELLCYHFSEAGIDQDIPIFRRLGTTLIQPNLHITHNGQSMIDLPVSVLVSAFHNNMQ